MDENEYIYGINPAFETVLTGRRKIIRGLFNRSGNRNSRLKKLSNLLQGRNIPVEWVEKGRLIDLSRSRENQGVIIQVSSYPYVSFQNLLKKQRLLLLDNVEDPRNTGAILRSAEIFGFHAVLLPNKGTCQVYPSVVKASAGATEHLQIAREASSNSYIDRAIENGFKIVVLDRKGSISIHDWQPAEQDRFVLVLGGEDKSAGQYILNKADVTLSLPQHGKINSLNTSVAAGITMFSLSSGK